MTARILVIDDVPANVKLLEARLSAEYFDVITALTGQEGLAICERADCDLVLLDVMMPNMDGFDVCRRLKLNPATHHIPVIMITALDHPSDRVKGLEAGADDFLTKPVLDIALIGRVRSLEILLRQPAFAMRRVRERHPFVVDQNVRVMIGSFGDGHQPIDEMDGLRKIPEGVLFLDRIAIERPALQRDQAPGDFFA